MKRLDFSGDFIIDVPVERAVSYLENFDSIINCLPGIEGYTKTPDGFDCHIRLDISAISTGYLSSLSGRLKVLISVADLGVIEVNSNGRIAGSAIRIRVTVHLESVPSGTLFRWESSADFGILSKLFDEGKISAVAKSNINSTVECLRRTFLEEH